MENHKKDKPMQNKQDNPPPPSCKMAQHGLNVTLNKLVRVCHVLLHLLAPQERLPRLPRCDRTQQALDPGLKNLLFWKTSAMKTQRVACRRHLLARQELCLHKSTATPPLTTSCQHNAGSVSDTMASCTNVGRRKQCDSITLCV